MTYALVTIIAPLSVDRLHETRARIDALGNPARPDLAAALDALDGDEGTHFASLHAIRSKDLGRAYLAFEFSADGGEDAAIARIARAIGEDLQSVFSLATDWRDGTDLTAYLRSHRITIGSGWFDNPGVAFAGTPGMSVGRIRAESRLAARITALLGAQAPDLSGLDRVDAIRAALREDGTMADMLETGEAAVPFKPPSTAALIVQLAASFATVYLWPVGVVLLLCALVGGIWYGSGGHGFWNVLGLFVAGAFGGLLASALIALAALSVAAILVYVGLRSAEVRDSLEERTAPRKSLAAMFERENRIAQNHMASITQRKPGPIRWFTARLVFWVVGELASRFYQPGFLSDIGTIHFARWVTPPGTRDLLFFSNYDSSWESYLEDFITRAHAGLTAVWSNSIGFPRTQNLFQKGATDGERFKRYARQSMIPTRFWYSAYPALTTTEIRTNHQIRLGLSGALTEDEAESWLALFGSAARPASKLVSSEIQSLVFGGLGFMPFATCLFHALPDAEADTRAWLAAVLPFVAFNDGRRLAARAVLTLAFGPEGLKRLGLPDEGLETFPYAFLDGITTQARARILGDTGPSAAEHWRWGRQQPHAALLIHGYTADEVAALEATLTDIAAAHGGGVMHRVLLKEVTADKREPFGFLDGVSQPVIRGTYKGLRSADPIHLVEPGEFILGYPDNRGNVPPGPTLPPTADPENQLPLVETAGDFTRNFVNGVRDLGRNGTFLVIRELEQDVAAFRTYCEAEAARLADRLPEPYRIDAAFIGAKLVGRWQDGSSLVRHPYLPRNEDHETRATERAKTGTGADAAVAHQVDRPAKASHKADNDFLFGTEDPEALSCPFGAHIRRANPRDSLDPGSADQIAISNRHRIIRIGRPYVPEPGGKPGLFFMCLNGDIERQFEFVQQTWLKSPSFHGLSCEKDPLLGDGQEGMCGFTIPSRDGPVRLSPVPQFVTTRGGGYFFLPGRRLIEFLADVS